jgi:hypothetical protein
MKAISFLIVLFHICYANASYYTNGHEKVHVNDIAKIHTSYSKTFIHDHDKTYTQSEIDKKSLEWVCSTMDGQHSHCDDCKPMGDELCKGAEKSTTYKSLFGEDVDNECVCVLVTSEQPPRYILYMKDGSDHYWDKLEFLESPKVHHPPIFNNGDNSTVNCTLLTQEYLREKCNVEQDPDYKDENYQQLLDLTYELLEMDPELWHVSIDRENGKITVYYDQLNIEYIFGNKLQYKLYERDPFTITQYSVADNVVFDIPSEVFWKNMSLTWEIYSTETWIYGVFPLANGTAQWYPHSRPDDLIVVDDCTRKCGAFCFKNPECMTDKQKNIKMGGLVTFALTLWLGILFIITFWWDSRVKEKAIGSGSRCKKSLLCIAIVGLMVPQVDAWGSCVATSFTQSKLIEHNDGIDHVVWSGNMFLANLNGASCFSITSHEDNNKVVAQVQLEVAKAEVVYQLSSQYSTYSYRAETEPPLTKCPAIFCQTIDCDDMCDNDRTCGDRIHPNEDYPGTSECSDQQPLNGCVDQYLYFMPRCERGRKIVGYHLEPVEWYLVSKLSNNPELIVDIKMTIDYLNGTKYSTTHKIESTAPNTVDPIFSIGDSDFYNNGISQTNTDPDRGYVMIHVQDTSFKSYPISTDRAYFVDANPVGTKNAGTIGAIQCRANERDQCDASDNICSIDFESDGNEVKCGIDPVATATTTRGVRLPVESDGYTYRISEDLTTLTAELSNIGSLNLFMNGKTALRSETVNVVPQCELIGTGNGCFQCTTGFWLKLKARSTADSGQAVVSIRHADSSNDNDVGVFDKIQTLTTDYREIHIHGFTEEEDNDLIITLTSGENSCSVPVAFKAHIDDKTAIAQRAEVFIPESESEASDIFGDLGDIGGFFSDFFGDIWPWLKWIVLIIIIGLLISFLGPCIGPLISGLIEGVIGITGGVFKGVTRGAYKAIKS